MGGGHIFQGEGFAVQQGAEPPGFRQGRDLAHDLAMPGAADAVQQRDQHQDTDMPQALQMQRRQILGRIGLAADHRAP